MQIVLGSQKEPSLMQISNASIIVETPEFCKSSLFSRPKDFLTLRASK